MDRLVARDGADHRNVERADGAFDRGAMAVAADTIQNDAGDANAGIEAGKAEHRGGGGLRLAGDIEHEQDRETEVDGKLGRCPLADRAGARAVEQPHGGFDDQEIGAGRRLIGDAVEERRPHGPAIEIEAGRAGSLGMEGGVDIVGPAFRGAHRQATAAKGGDERKRDRGLARAGARGGDEERFCLRPHVTPPSQAPWPRGREAWLSPSR